MTISDTTLDAKCTRCRVGNIDHAGHSDGLVIETGQFIDEGHAEYEERFW